MENYLDFEHISEELIDEFYDNSMVTANNVYNSVISSQNNISIIHGPYSKNNRHYSSNNNSLTINLNKKSDFFVDSEKIINIYANNVASSLILSGLKDTTLIFHDKINHILVRKSKELILNINKGTLSGIDIIHCSNIKVYLPFHNFTNIEFGENIRFNGEINDLSIINIMGSLDVKSNNNNIPINPFESATLTKENIFYNHLNHIPKITILKN